MKVRLTQIDGKLPNLALMRLAAWHRFQGDEVFWERGVTRKLHEPDYDKVYGSAIFTTSARAVLAFTTQFPGALVGGSGGDVDLRVESIVPTQFVGLDYSGYPRFTASIGYAMRGCRFKCGFCVVPKLEGAARSAASIDQIWRGDPFPRHLHLLDNDFFGNPRWREIVAEILAGGFRVCINQGINVRLIDDEQAAAIASIPYKTMRFSHPGLYTAWDNLGDERVFFDGVDRLERAGIPPVHLIVYMLIGYDRRETMERIWHRYQRMVDRGIGRPYPMVHDRARQENPEHWRLLKRFQSWVLTPKPRRVPFSEFRPDHKAPMPPGDLLPLMETR